MSGCGRANGRRVSRGRFRVVGCGAFRLVALAIPMVRMNKPIRSFCSAKACSTRDGRKRAEARGVKMGRRPKLTDHKKRDAIKRRDHGDETLAEIGRSYNVSGWTISRLER